MLRDMSVMHPAARMLVDLSSAQDVEAGDGTTSVVVVAGSLLAAAERLLSKGIHPTVISESFQRASAAAVEILHNMSQPINLVDRASLLQAASTSLSSKIVSQHSGLLGPMAVDSVMKVVDPKTAENVDLRDIRIVKKVGGTIEDSEMVDGLVLNQPVIKSSSGPTRIEKARIGLIQFQLSPPKPDVCYLNSCLQTMNANSMPADGEPDCGERLPPNGQDPQGRAPIPPEYGEEDSEIEVQCPPDPKVYSPRCCQRPVSPLPFPSQDPCREGHRT